MEGEEKKQVDGESIGKSFSWTAAVVLLKNDDLKKKKKKLGNDFVGKKIVCVFFVVILLAGLLSKKKNGAFFFFLNGHRFHQNKPSFLCYQIVMPQCTLSTFYALFFT